MDFAPYSDSRSLVLGLVGSLAWVGVCDHFLFLFHHDLRVVLRVLHLVHLIRSHDGQRPPEGLSTTFQEEETAEVQTEVHGGSLGEIVHLERKRNIVSAFFAWHVAVRS